jgi:hypothetical protein
MKWTQQEIEYLKQNFDKTTYQNIATDLNRTLKSITKKIEVLGLQKEFYKPWRIQEIKYLKENLHKKNYHYYARILDRTKASVIAKIRELT